MNIYILLRKLKRRWLLYRYGIKNAAKTVMLAPGSSISKDLIIGDYAYIGSGCSIAQGVIIGKYSMIANDVTIVGGDHNYHNTEFPMIFSGRDKNKETKIGIDCWIGTGSIIMAGVTIGNGSIIAAGSVVTKDVPPLVIYGGSPAKFIKRRFSEEEEERYITKMKNFNYPAEKLELMMVSGRNWKNDKRIMWM